MTDQYEPVTADDLNIGDEVEVTIKAYCYANRGLRTDKLVYFHTDAVDAIRRKVRPISVGDRVTDGYGKKGAVLCVHRREAWVDWPETGPLTVHLSDLTRIPPEPDWTPWSGGENPVPGKMVEVELRDDEGSTNRSDVFHWEHGYGAADIIAYRVVKGGA